MKSSDDVQTDVTQTVVTHPFDDVTQQPSESQSPNETPYGYITQQEAPQETLSLLPALTLPSCHFSHATNTRSRLIAACAANDDEINFIEADVLYSSSMLPFMTAISSLHDSKQDPNQGFAVLGHSPSDLTKADAEIRDLLSFSLESQKGIKIDIKNYQAIQPCLDAIHEMDEASNDGTGKASWRLMRFYRSSPSSSFDIPAIMINADILTGTGPVCVFNSTSSKLSRREQVQEARQFITTVGEAVPYAILSLGWTTEREGLGYSEEMIDDMEQVLEGFVDMGLQVTLAVRASYVRSSIHLLSRFLKHQTVSFTVWSNCKLSKGEEEWIRSTLPSDRTAYDLPRDESGGGNDDEEEEGILKRLTLLEAAGIGAVVAGVVAAAFLFLLKRKA